MLWLSDNPCAKAADYRLQCIRQLPRLEKLDNVDVTPDERAAAAAAGAAGRAAGPTSEVEVAGSLEAYRGTAAAAVELAAVVWRQGLAGEATGYATLLGGPEDEGLALAASSLGQRQAPATGVQASSDAGGAFAAVSRSNSICSRCGTPIPEVPASGGPSRAASAVLPPQPGPPAAG